MRTETREIMKKFNKIITHKLAREAAEDHKAVCRCRNSRRLWCGERVGVSWSRMLQTLGGSDARLEEPVRLAHQAGTVATLGRMIRSRGRRGRVVHQYYGVRFGVGTRHGMSDHAEVLLIESEEGGAPARNCTRTRSASRSTHAWRIHAEVRRADNARHPRHTRVAEELQKKETVRARVDRLHVRTTNMSRLPVEMIERVVSARGVGTARRDVIPQRRRLPPVVAPRTQRRRRTYFRDFVGWRGLAARRRYTGRWRIRTTHRHVAGRTNNCHRPRHRRQRRRRKHCRRKILWLWTS